jgi:hypothetical protein
VSPSEALVVGVDGAVNASGLYPLVMTTDNARGWELVSLPPLPGQVPGAQQSLFVLPTVPSWTSPPNLGTCWGLAPRLGAQSRPCRSSLPALSLTRPPTRSSGPRCGG